MADATLVSQVLELLGPNAPAAGWNEIRVGNDLDNGLSPNAIALAWWQARAAALVDGVDISEGGSSRSTSQAWAQANNMVKYYQGLVDRERPVVNAQTPLRSYTMRRV